MKIVALYSFSFFFNNSLWQSCTIRMTIGWVGYLIRSHFTLFNMVFVHITQNNMPCQFNYERLIRSILFKKKIKKNSSTSFHLIMLCYIFFCKIKYNYLSALIFSCHFGSSLPHCHWHFNQQFEKNMSHHAIYVK